MEKRRKDLQNYLRQILNNILTLDRDLNVKPCRETLTKAVPFLSDQYLEASSVLLNDTSNLINRSYSLISNHNGLNQMLQGNTITVGSVNSRNGSTSLLNNQELTNSPSARDELLYTGL